MHSPYLFLPPENHIAIVFADFFPISSGLGHFAMNLRTVGEKSEFPGKISSRDGKHIVTSILILHFSGATVFVRRDSCLSSPWRSGFGDPSPSWMLKSPEKKDVARKIESSRSVLVFLRVFFLIAVTSGLVTTTWYPLSSKKIF